MSNAHPNTLIAIPCYDERVLPRFDQAHEFVLANINAQHGVINSTTIKPCPLPAAQIVSWLVEQGVNGVICAGIHQQYQLQMQQLGLWLIWGITGEIIPQLQHWLDQQTVLSDAKHNVSDSCFCTCNEISSI